MSSITITVDDAKNIVALYPSEYHSVWSQVCNLEYQLVQARQSYGSVAVSTSLNSYLQGYGSIIYNLESELHTQMTYLKTLKASYENALCVLNNSLGLETSSVDISFEGPTGPTGPIGTTIGGSTGSTGSSGTVWNSSTSLAEDSVGSLYLATSVSGVNIEASSVNVSSLSVTDTASVDSVVINGNLKDTNSVLTSMSVLSVPGLLKTTTLAISTSLDAGGITVTSKRQPVYESTTVANSDSYDYSSSGNVYLTTLEAGNLYSTGILTASSGLVGSAIGSQTSVTTVGTLTGLSVAGVASAASLNVSGLFTSTGFDGTLLTAAQPNVTHLGTLTQLTVGSGTCSVGGDIQQSYAGSSMFVSTTSSATNSLQLRTYTLGIGSTTGFYVGTGSTFPLRFSSSGYFALNTASTSASASVDLPFDMGSNTSNLGSLSKPCAFLGLPSASGVVLGYGTSSTNPYIAASHSYLGTATGLEVWTGSGKSIGISSTGAVSFVSSNLSVAGTSFSSSTYGNYGAMGFTQSWTDVTSSRIFSTTYTNSSGKPIQLMISITGSSSVGTSLTPFYLYCGSTIIDLAYSRYLSNYLQLRGIVPASSTYKITGTGGTISSWYELK